MKTLYLVMDQLAVWGVGQTVGECIKDATHWIINPETGQPDLATDQLEAMIISEHDSRNGKNGFFIDSFEADCPDNVSELDSDQLYELYLNNQ